MTTTFSGVVRSGDGFASDELVVTTGICISHDNGAGANPLPALDGAGYHQVEIVDLAGDALVNVVDSEGNWNEGGFNDPAHVDDPLQGDAAAGDWRMIGVKPGPAVSRQLVLECKRSGRYRVSIMAGYCSLPTPDTAVAVELYDYSYSVIGLSGWSGRGIAIHNGVQNVPRYYKNFSMNRAKPSPFTQEFSVNQRYGVWISDCRAGTVTASYAQDASFNMFYYFERVRSESE